MRADIALLSGLPLAAATGAVVDTGELETAQLVGGGIVLLLVAVGLLAGLIFTIRFLLAGWRDWQRGARLLLRRPPTAGALGLLLAVVIFLNLLAILTFPWWARVDEQGNVAQPMLLVLIQSLTLHWMAVLFCFCWMKWRGLSWKRLFGSSMPGNLPRRFMQGVVAFLIGYPLAIAFTYLWQQGLRAYGLEVEPQQALTALAEAQLDWLWVYAVFVAVVLAPISEEIVFRGLLLPPLSRKLGIVTAVFTSSIIFSMIHFHLAAAGTLFVFSVILSVAYIYTSSLIVPIVMHAVFNLVNVILFLLVHGFI